LQSQLSKVDPSIIQSIHKKLQYGMNNITIIEKPRAYFLANEPEIAAHLIQTRPWMY
jgi:hypothetical protein